MRNKPQEAFVSILGHLGTLIFGDTLVIDRWKWIESRLPRTNEPLKLLDVGCGSGAFTIGAALRGYEAYGLSWDEANQKKAAKRANILACPVNFEVFDARNLDSYPRDGFSFILNCENIEHIIDDKKLMNDMAEKLLPGGLLLLTSPNFFYKAISKSDNGPFCKEETGWHVRRGYTISMLTELCELSGLRVIEVSFVSGYLSQKITWLIRLLNTRLGVPLTWLITLPLRALPLLFDAIISSLSGFPGYSICLVAQKSRFTHAPYRKHE
jgi:SAM-dependent methyltransferase